MKFLFSVEIFVEKSGQVFDLSFITLINSLSSFLLLLDLDFVSFD